MGGGGGRKKYVRFCFQTRPSKRVSRQEEEEEVEKN
jgi:hypothetical protein